MSQHRKNTADTLKVCNCASCKKELLSRRYSDWFAKLSTERKVSFGYTEMVFCRHEDRPYCRDCASEKLSEEEILVGGGTPYTGKKSGW